MTALYSINLHVMGKSNVPVSNESTVATQIEAMGKSLFRADNDLNVFGWAVGVRDAAMLIGMLCLVTLLGLVLYLFFRTNLGTAMRATGDNPQMIRALGVSVDFILILGLALSNGLIALAGSLLAQYQGFADVQMGIGMVVWGLASVIIGEALVGSQRLGLLITGAVMGSVLFRLLVAIALRWGLSPNDLKLITAAFVFVALIAPGLVRKLKSAPKPSAA
jgi:putative ABC transport system permease protein